MKPFQEQRQSSQAIRSAYEELCMECGACCVAYNSADKWAIATPSDHQIPKSLIQIGPRNRRGDNQYLRSVTLKDKKFSGRLQFQKCVALQGTVREAVKCGVYDARPPCCSNFDPGSLACIASRQWAGMRDPEDVFCIGRS